VAGGNWLNRDPDEDGDDNNNSANGNDAVALRCTFSELLEHGAVPCVKVPLPYPATTAVGEHRLAEDEAGEFRAIIAITSQNVRGPQPVGNPY